MSLGLYHVVTPSEASLELVKYSQVHMSLVLYHVVAPSEARLELVYQLLGMYRVGGVRSAQVWFRKKILLSYFPPILFVCVFHGSLQLAKSHVRETHPWRFNGFNLETCEPRSYFTNSNLASLGATTCYKPRDIKTQGLLNLAAWGLDLSEFRSLLYKPFRSDV